MLSSKLAFALLLIFIIACSPEGTKIYKVDYKGNYPEVAFSARIGNNTIFTNGPSVLEVHVERNPGFFCYAVNKEVLCKLNLNVKVDEDAAEEYLVVTQRLKESLLKSGKNRSILTEMFVYYLNDEKFEENALFVNNLQNKPISLLPVAVSGKGVDEKEAQKNSMKKFNEIVGILTDKK